MHDDDDDDVVVHTVCGRSMRPVSDFLFTRCKGSAADHREGTGCVTALSSKEDVNSMREFDTCAAAWRFFYNASVCVRLCLYILYICSTWRREIETLNAWMSLNRQMSLNTDVLYIIIYKYLYLSAQQQNITSLVTWQDKYLMFSAVLNTHSLY